MFKFSFLIAAVFLVGVLVEEMGVVSGAKMENYVGESNRVKRQAYAPATQCRSWGPGVPPGYCEVDSDCGACGQVSHTCHGADGPCKWTCQPQAIKQCVLSS